MLNVVTLYFTQPRPGDSSEGRRDFWREWGPTYLRRLHAGCVRHIKEPFEFSVITDNPTAVIEALPAGALANALVVGPEEDVPGWWMKLKLFDPAFDVAGIRGRTLYLDLDNVISGDLTPYLALLDEDECLVMLDDKVYPKMANGAAYLCRPERMREVWTNYAASPYAIRRRFSRWPNASDQAYVAAWHQETFGVQPLLAQDLLPPGTILNSRVELEQGADWSKAILVYGSWDPKPHMSSHPFYAEHWVG